LQNLTERGIECYYFITSIKREFKDIA